MLHLVFQTPLDAALLARFAPGDAVVFLSGAVLNLLSHGRWADHLTALSATCAVFALADALAVRGLATSELAEGLAVVDYAGLVRLTETYPVSQTWA